MSDPTAGRDLQAILDAVTDALFIFDTSGRIVRASRWGRDRFVGHVGALPPTLAEIRARVDPRYPDGMQAPLLPAERALLGEQVDTQLIFSDGRRLHIRAAPIRDAEGRIRGAVSISRDITDVRAAEVERAQLDGAVKTARLVTHEINNQLQLVTAYGGLLQDGGGLSGPNLDMLRHMIAAADRMAALLERLQRITRFEETDIGGGPMLDLNAAIDRSP